MSVKNLEKELGLIEIRPEEIVIKDPTEKNLKNVPKIIQTEEMIMFVCKKDGLALKHASQKLITPEVCEIAVDQNGMALKYVPNKIIKLKGKEWYADLCIRAVSSNGYSIEVVPEEYITKKIVEIALLKCKFIPERLPVWRKLPIAYISPYYLTDDLLRKSVERIPICIKDIPKDLLTRELIEVSVKANGSALRFVPREYINEKIISMAIDSNELAIRYVPPIYLTQTICDKCFERNFTVLGYLPLEFVTKEMCLKAINQKEFKVNDLEDDIDEWDDEEDIEFDKETVYFKDIPEIYRNDKDILEAILKLYNGNALPLLKWNKKRVEKKKDYFELDVDKRNDNIKPLKKASIDYINNNGSKKSEKDDNRFDEAVSKLLNKKELSGVKNNELTLHKEIPSSYYIVPNNIETLMEHDFSENETVTQKIYYISDIHIEHQMYELIELLKNKSKAYKEKIALNFVKEKISEMIPSENYADDILLIGGDVADSVHFSNLFYQELYSQWRGGPIISILGNHELWDGTNQKQWNDPSFKSRPIEEIVQTYKNEIQRGNLCSRENGIVEQPISTNNYFGLNINSIILENELFIKYKNRASRILKEDEILNASISNLTEVLEKCTYIVLGGIGYSGLNPIYNADAGLYRKAITSIEEDKKRTERFSEIYNKVMECARNRKVIVLTHTPVYDWTSDKYNPNWIYVNGHTHINALNISDDGTAVLSDNQIGYNPSKWKLKSFMIDIQWYNPFKDYKDGIYEITSDEYKEFNRGRGILSNGCSYEGKLYMLKRNEMYMFVLKTIKSLSLMVGGQRKSLHKRDVQYYYDNLLTYSENIKKIIAPYEKIIKQISDEVKKIGGSGNIHGCIVDISYFSHIYLNPYDGTITPYWALTPLLKQPYTSIEKFIKENEPTLLENYHLASKKKEIPLIGKKELNENMENNIATIPEWVLDKEIYKPSRIMKAIQFVWQQNIIRIWNDDVLQTTSQNPALIKKKTEN